MIHAIFPIDSRNDIKPEARAAPTARPDRPSFALSAGTSAGRREPREARRRADGPASRVARASAIYGFL
jgi:hypothetical protein